MHAPIVFFSHRLPFTCEKKTATIHNLHPSLNETFGSNHKQLWPREQKQNAESGKDSSNAFVSRQVVYVYIYKAKILRLIALAGRQEVLPELRSSLMTSFCGELRIC